jgi:pentatricopeptide repeat protein
LTLIAKNPDKIKSMDVDAVIRGGIRRFSHEVGNLWTSLADYYIRLGHFEKARDIYEEGINMVSTVRDFSLIFDAYTQVSSLCSLLSALCSLLSALSFCSLPFVLSSLLSLTLHAYTQYEESMLAAKMEAAEQVLHTSHLCNIFVNTFVYQYVFVTPL